MFFHMVYKSGQIFLPFCHNPRVWRTDGRTDGRTDRILIAGPRLHSMQRDKKAKWKNKMVYSYQCCFTDFEKLFPSTTLIKVWRGIHWYYLAKTEDWLT